MGKQIAREDRSLAPERLEGFERRYERLFKAEYKANLPPKSTGKKGRPRQSKAKNLLDQLDKHHREVLRFMHDFRVPFDNNQAERNLRMVKVRQKVSGCLRTMEEAEMFCRIRGYIYTVRKQGQEVLGALEGVFVGEPFIPSLRA